ncbi:NTP binding protein, putative [Paecilomyces variotii No. 5]|uniref:NTP binding protein, putative n=1 Tax=Byssochlamys spectabilis (strain No. 5 / NBRC 109023) TaxID=1356009 RepID=V5FPJ8_BYSSN|nr:NTP binding protein, putative [Paecilomyces variotii No. 5]
MEGRVELPADRPLSSYHDHHVQTKRRSNVKVPRTNGRQHKKSVTFEDNLPTASSRSVSAPETILRVQKYSYPMSTTVEQLENGGFPRSGSIMQMRRQRDSRASSATSVTEARLRAIADARDAYLRARHAEVFTDGLSSEMDHDGRDAIHKSSSLTRLMRHEKERHRHKAHATGTNEDKLLVRGANPRTGIISPSVTTDSSQDEKAKSTKPRDKKQKWRMRGDEWISLDVDQSTPGDTPPAGQSVVANKDSASSSHNLVSPIEPMGTASNWEDTFIVNMPSARDPNPPTMTAQQIREYQKSIEKVRLEGGKMLDPDTLPSPRAVTPEQQSAPDQRIEKQPSVTVQRKPIRNVSAETYIPSPVSPPLGPRQYYNADDVGRDHVSPIDEESPSRGQQDKRFSAGADTFLGCREVGKTKNPDEILMFPTLNDSPYPTMPLSPESKRRSAGKRKSDINQKRQSAEEKAILHDEKPLRSRNSRPIQCSKQPLSSPPRQSGLNKLTPNSLKNKSLPPLPKESSEKSPSSDTSSKENQNDDDVFIITPTITRTPISNTIPTSTTQPHLGGRSVQGTKSPKADDAVHVPRTRSHYSAPRPQWHQQMSMLPRSETFFMMPQGNAQGGGMSGIRNRAISPQGRERFSIMPGHIRMSRMMTFEQDTGDARSNHEFCLCRRCITENQNPFPNIDYPLMFEDIPRPVPTPRFQDLTAPPSPVLEGRPKSVARARTPKTDEIAELDSLQVPASDSARREQDTALVRRNMGKSDADISSSVFNFLSFSLLFDICVLSATQLYDFSHRYNISQHASIMAERVFDMAGHCFHVAKRVLNGIVVYKRTGSWPKSNNEEIALLMRDMGQAGIYFFVLGFVIMILGRAAGYMVFLGSWVVWVAKPFGWLFGKVGKALFI